MQTSPAEPEQASGPAAEAGSATVRHPDRRPIFFRVCPSLPSAPHTVQGFRLRSLPWPSASPGGLSNPENTRRNSSVVQGFPSSECVPIKPDQCDPRHPDDTRVFPHSQYSILPGAALRFSSILRHVSCQALCSYPRRTYIHSYKASPGCDASFPPPTFPGRNPLFFPFIC